MENLPIDLDILQKRKEIPVKIAELSYKDEEKAIHFMRMWGEKKIPITEIHELLSMSLREHTKLTVGTYTISSSGVKTYE